MAALAGAERSLNAGHSATALLWLKDTFVNAPDRFADLKPWWARAYRDLGRPGYAECLDLMVPSYQK